MQALTQMSLTLSGEYPTHRNLGYLVMVVMVWITASGPFAPKKPEGKVGREAPRA